MTWNVVTSDYVHFTEVILESTYLGSSVGGVPIQFHITAYQSSFFVHDDEQVSLVSPTDERREHLDLARNF